MEHSLRRDKLEAGVHMEGQECMKVLKRVDEDLSSLGSKVT